MRDRRSLLIATALLLALHGCGHIPQPSPERGGGAFREDPDIQWVWMADGFSFVNYDTLVIEETKTDVAQLNPDGVENLAWSRGVLRDEIAKTLRAKNAFKTVSANATDALPRTRVLRLQNTITEYEKGGGGARFWAGHFGGGLPVIRVHGRFLDGDRLVAAFETRRSGVRRLSRTKIGAFREDKAIQAEDIEDLANGLANFVNRNGGASRPKESAWRQ